MGLARQVKETIRGLAVHRGDKPMADAGFRHLLLEAGPAEFVSTPDGVSSIFHQVNEHG